MNRFKRINEEVFYATEPQTEISSRDIAALIEQAKLNKRGRARICTHLSPNDALHEMIIVHTDDCYVRPHRHLRRAESLQVWEGDADLLFFDETGELTSVVQLGKTGDRKAFYNRISTPVFHSLIIRSPYLVFYEATQGPFDSAETEFAPWAPEQENESECRKYLSRLELQIADIKTKN